MTKKNTKHTLSLILMCLTCLFWGSGFVVNKQMLDKSFGPTPGLLNTIRFAIAIIALTVIFAPKLKFNKNVVKYAGIGGLFLFGGFLFQLSALNYTTPSNCGFFTSLYVIFVPFIVWIALKHRPSIVTLLGAIIAIIGMLILNFTPDRQNNPDMALGNAITIAGALMFALQIVWADQSLKKGKVDSVNMTYWQLFVAFLLFIVYTLSVESNNYSDITLDIQYCWWRMALVSLGGTAFAYYSQTFSQNHLSPSETSLLMACESPVGAVISVLTGIEQFSAQLTIGGLLIVCAVIIVEILPHRKNKTAPILNLEDEIPQEEPKQ